MGFGEAPGSKKERSTAKTRGETGRNEKATKNYGKKHNLTDYVNNCNYSTPDIGGNGQGTTDI